MLRAQILVALAEELRSVLPEHIAALSATGTPPDEPAFRRRFYRIAEYAAALELSLVPWCMVSPDLLERFDLARWGPDGLVAHPDYGVDAWSVDGLTTAQVKWYAPDSTVSFRSLCTFLGLSSVLRAERRLIVPSAGVSVHWLATRAEHVSVSPLTNEALARWVRTACDEYPRIVNERVDELAELLADESEVSEEPAEEVVEPADSSDEETLWQFGDSDEESDTDESSSVALSVSSAPARASKDPAPVRRFVEPWPEQVDAARAACARLLNVEARTRAVVVMPCGTGKSIVVAEYIRNAPKERIAVMVPSRLLLHQMYATLVAQLNLEDHEIGLVGDSFDQSDRRIVVCIYNSVGRISELSFHTVVVDEGHHMHAANDNTRVWSRCITALDTMRLLLVSASMSGDNDTVYELSKVDAVERKRIVDTTLLIPVLERDGDPKSALVDLLYERTELTRVLAYCNSRTAGKLFREMLVAKGIPAAYFDATNRAAERREFISRLETGEVRVLVTVRVLSEGIDIPCATTCLFVEPRNGHNEALQCMGRVERLHAEKQLAYVVLPSTNEEKELERFLRVMSRADPRIRAAVAAGRSGRVNITACAQSAAIDRVAVYAHVSRLLAGAAGEWQRKCDLVRAYAAANGRLPVRTYKADDGTALGAWIGTQRRNRAKLTTEQQASLESIAGWQWQMIENRTKEWQRKCDLVRAYVATNGRLPIQHYKAEDGTALGKWISHQRQNRAKLTTEHQTNLESIEGWQWRVREVQKPVLADRAQEWQRKCDLVRAYATANGHLPVRSHKADDGTSLARWISHQRENQAKLTAERQASLESIAGWQWRVLEMPKPVLADRAQEWQRKCDLVRAYAAANGQLPARSYKADDGTALGQWIGTQRTNRAKLTAERQASLESIIGWQWRVVEKQKPVLADRTAEWQRKCDLVRAYAAANGRIPAKSYKADDGTKLGAWISTQRQNQAKLTAERRTSLESIAGWYW